MKKGRWDIEGLAAEIQRQQEAKVDFLAPTNMIDVFSIPSDEGEETGVFFDIIGCGTGKYMSATAIAHDQVAAYCGIPMAYYDKMKTTVPLLLCENIRTWFTRKPEVRVVRTLDNSMRAFLSRSYRPLDNWDFMEAVVPALLDRKLEIMSCEVTETRLYLKAVDPAITRDVPRGVTIGDGSHVFFDTCSPALILSNSEVGFGTLRVETGVFTKVCTNLATISDGGMKRRHAGGRHGLSNEGEKIEHMLTDETKRASDGAIWMQVRDVVKAGLDEAEFDARCKRLGAMSKDRIDKDVVEVVGAAAKKYSLSDMIRGKVQQHLIENADLTRYGLFNAVTRAAQDVESYDVASGLERTGGKIVDLSHNEWAELAMAA